MLAYATLLHLRAPFADLLTAVAEWLSTRTRQPWNADQILDATVWQYPQIEVRTALARPHGSALWALQVNTRDGRVAGRDWQLELMLRDREAGGVRATVAVHASDVRGVERDAPPVPYSQPALVRALLERGQPDPDTPGLAPFPLDSEADAQAVAARIRDARRAHVVVAVCRGESALDVASLRTAATGLADVVELRPVMPHEVAAALKAVQAWPPPGRAAVFAPRDATDRSGDADGRQVYAADARLLAATLLRLGAPRILAAHRGIERVKAAGALEAREDAGHG